MTLLRAFSVWILMILVEIVHGIVRGIFLVPLVGDLGARQIGVFTGSILIFGIAYTTSRWLGAKTVTSQIGIGLFWVLLTLVFEVTVGVFVIGADKARIIEDYDLANGGLMPIGLLFMFLAPMLASWIDVKIHSAS